MTNKAADKLKPRLKIVETSKPVDLSPMGE
jgi:hypothetical protein